MVGGGYDDPTCHKRNFLINLVYTFSQVVSSIVPCQAWILLWLPWNFNSGLCGMTGVIFSDSAWPWLTPKPAVYTACIWPAFDRLPATYMPCLTISPSYTCHPLWLCPEFAAWFFNQFPKCALSYDLGY